jgi:ParB-like nuclease domain
MSKRNVPIIPIAEIRVVNPRSRNRTTFNAMKANIASVGLKKPITVHQRALEEDGTRYDLVCGQGRLESVRALHAHFHLPVRAETGRANDGVPLRRLNVPAARAMTSLAIDSFGQRTWEKRFRARCLMTRWNAGINVQSSERRIHFFE